MLKSFAFNHKRYQKMFAFWSILALGLGLYFLLEEYGVRIGVGSIQSVRLTVFIFIFSFFLMNFAKLELTVFLSIFYAKYIFPQKITLWIFIFGVILILDIFMFQDSGLLHLAAQNLMFFLILLLVLFTIAYFSIVNHKGTLGFTSTCFLIIPLNFIKPDFFPLDSGKFSFIWPFALVSLVILYLRKERYRKFFKPGRNLQETKIPENYPDQSNNFSQKLKQIDSQINNLITKREYSKVLKKLRELDVIKGDKEAKDRIRCRTYLILNDAKKVVDIYDKYYKGKKIKSSRLVYYFLKALHSVEDRLKEARSLVEWKIADLKKMGHEGNPYLHLKFGLILFWMHDFEGAIEQENIALALDSNCSMAKVCLALFSAAAEAQRPEPRPEEFDLHLRKIQDAIDSLSEEKDIITKIELALFKDIRAFIYYLKGDDESLKIAYEEFIKLLRDNNFSYNSWLHFHLGRVYLKKEIYRKAISSFQKAITLEEKNPYNAVVKHSAKKWLTIAKIEMHERAIEGKRMKKAA